MTFHDWAGPPYTPKKVAGVAGAIIAVFTVITMISNTMGVAEPYWVVTRGYMRDHVESIAKKQETSLAEASTRQIGIEIRIEDESRRRIRSKIADLELELKKNPDAPEGLRRAIQDQIAEQKQELEYKDSVVNDLRRLQRKAP